MTDDHKAALAKGRAEGRIVRDYLEGLRANKPKRGRKRTPESISARLTAIEDQLLDADALAELRLLQERRDLQDELATKADTVDLSALEEAFVGVADAYGQRQGISYDSWREVGVAAAVLKRAGVSRRG